MKGTRLFRWTQLAVSDGHERKFNLLGVTRSGYTPGITGCQSKKIGDKKAGKLMQVMAAAGKINRSWDGVRSSVADPEGRRRAKLGKHSPRQTRRLREVLAVG